jgi:hypothetical protein
MPTGVSMRRVASVSPVVPVRCRSARRARMLSMREASMVDAKGSGDVFKSCKDERYLFSKQLMLKPFNFESQIHLLASILVRKWLKMPVYAGVLFSTRT